MVRLKSENVIRKHFKLTEKTAKILNERSKAEGMNESEYIRYLLLNQSEYPKSRKLELEVMRLRNEINRKIFENLDEINDQIIKISMYVYDFSKNVNKIRAFFTEKYGNYADFVNEESNPPAMLGRIG